MSSIIKTISGYCPCLKCKTTIDVKFDVVYISMNPNPQTKKIEYNCDSIEKCTITGDCPIYIAV